MEEIQVTARFNIHPDGHDRFREIADECIRIVDEEDTGTLQYDWFFNESGDECVVRETYANSDALLEHIAHVGEQLGAILEVADIDLEVFGDPSPELAEAAAGLGPRVYGFHGGAARA
ncbi:MAG: antibiotic biosynthesis monooxygenase [Gemmatimonadota bacterium]|nr:antibiotic biosynthesis monooxygenase [Gemmatimonadota bacterium]